MQYSTIDRRKQVAKLINEGASHADIARQLGVSKGTIMNDVQILRYQRMLPRRDVLGRQDRVAELLNSGWKPTEIAEELGVSSKTIYNDRSRLAASGRVPS